MNCPRCNANVAFSKKRCDNCGHDLKNYRKVVSLSNTYYNKGLSQAKVRDLSGAVSSLKLSLQYNKLNTNARNLLGLIYLEEGEIVAALSEWVISRHYQAENNDAEDYIRQIQSNPNRLETYNQTIRKYNSALNSAKHGDEDMAVIQLKKVVNLNPNFIRAHQLLALLYMMTGKKDNRVKALKLLRHISKIDVTSYEAGKASAWSLFKLDASKTTTSTSAVTKIDIDKYSHSTAEKKDTSFVEKTVITMTDLTPSLPTTAKSAVQGVITRVVNELANDGKATWYELNITKTEKEQEAKEIVSIKVSPYMSGTNAIADIDIVAGGSAYLVRATADLSGSKKIAVDVIQGETSFATAYFTSNIAGVITSNESVQVSDVKVIPTANAIRVLNADKASYQIYSITGAMMANGTIAGDAYISTANLAKGIYIVVVEANGVKQSVKFIR